MTRISHIYYRGSLNFCNYACSYCPFSKKKGGVRQIERDREQLFRFVRTIRREAGRGFAGTVQIVPYGEALIHEYYWRGMAELSRIPHIRAVGAQSNFSFPVEDMLRQYEYFGGDRKKLRLWGTFHPEMTTVPVFLEQCRQLLEADTAFCVGGVAVPEHAESLRKLRAELGSSVYMWLNKMDGLSRAYTDKERTAFLDIDKYFELELRHIPANASACGGSALIVGNGDIYPCVLCHKKLGNIYEDGLPQAISPSCTRTLCDCFLAYGSRSDIEELEDFGTDPVFRIVEG